MASLTNPIGTLSPAQVYLRLWLRSLTMTTVQGFGVVFFARGSWLALVTAFLIGIMWTKNVTDTVDYRHPYVRLSYALGASSGAALVLAAARWL